MRSVILKVGATVLTLGTTLASALYVTAHLKNPSAPLQPAVLMSQPGDTVGGVFSYAMELSRALARREVRVVLATMGGGTLTATKEGGKTVLTDAAGHKAAVTKADELFTNGVVHHVDAMLMPAKAALRPAVGQKAGK